jgi:hypothetical protein
MTYHTVRMPLSSRMTNNKSRRSRNVIQNVRIVDRDEGRDDLRVQRMLNTMVESESQIRVVCGYQTTQNVAVASGVVGFGELLATDDFVSFAAQYQEYRVAGIRFDIYDVNQTAVVVNFWATFHQVSGSVPVAAEDIMDRPDCRSLSAGEGKATLAWLAHGIPERAFNNVGTNAGLGGLSYNLSPAAASTTAKYTIMAKFIVDFRGRR